MSNDTTLIVTVLVHQGGNIDFHKPGCSHQNRRSVVQVQNYDHTVSWLRDVQEEAKELGDRNPIAPCLRATLKEAE